MKRLLASKPFLIGAGLLIAGSAPLLLVVLCAALGWTDDPNPNPIGFGMLAGLTFWPAVILMIVGIVRSRSR